MAEQKFTCIRCGKTFTSEHELQEHVKNCKDKPHGGQTPDKDKKQPDYVVRGIVSDIQAGVRGEGNPLFFMENAIGENILIGKSIFFVRQ